MYFDVGDMESRMDYFANNYNLIFHYCHNQNKSQYVDSTEEGKVCRFCGKRSPEVTFNKKAHAISELLGNKEFVSRTECDICNLHFGQFLEDDLSKYLGCGRTLSQIATKNGVPSYKSKDGKSRVDFTEKGLVIQCIEGSDFVENQNNLMIFHAVRQTYSPLSVYKAFVKMALSMLPYTEMVHFIDTVSWLKETSNVISRFDMSNYAFMIERFVPGPHILPLEMWGFIRKDGTKLALYYQFVISFGNLIVQIPVPCNVKDRFSSGTNIGIIAMPHYYDSHTSPFGKINSEIKIMSNSKKVSDDPLTLYMHYDKKERHDGNGKTISDLFEKEGIELKKRLAPKNDSNK